MTFRSKAHIFRFLTGVFLLLAHLQLLGQNIHFKWEDHFSYANVSNIIEVNGFLLCSAENGYFTYSLSNGELEKTSKVNELNDVGISAFSYNPELELLLIGYESGEMDMLGPIENNNLLEIPLHQSFTGSKIVNHITSAGHTAIISGEFGLASFSLEDFEFMETCYFTQAGVYFGVKESAILNGVIYAASDKGVFYHVLDEFIANFTVWEQPPQLPTTAFQHIIAFHGNLLASSGNTVYRFNGSDWSIFGNYPDLQNISSNGNRLSITMKNQAYHYNENLAPAGSANFIKDINTSIAVGNSTFGGSKEFGLIVGNNEILPDGPYNNKSWSVTSANGQVWIAPGGMVDFNNVQGNEDGFYHFNGQQWLHITSEEILGAKDVVDIEVNPNDITEIYVSTWFEHTSWQEPETHIGMFKFKNGVMVDHYNSGNGKIKFRERIGGSRFDDQGNLWIGQSVVQPGDRTYMIRKSPGDNFEFIDLAAQSTTFVGARKPVTYNGFAFMAGPRDGGVMITDMQNIYHITSATNNGGLPSDAVFAVEIDKNGVLWIGTELGLRILYNPINAVQSGAFQTQPVIIEQNGIPEALLTDVQINDIVTDGANQKWVATVSGGVYCFSEDGTETIHHFTTANSPLPSNSVNKISVDNTTGKVYFATQKGVVSYSSDAVDVGDSFGDVYSYPNPVRPGFSGEVTIKGLPRDADVRIVDVVGNLIYKTKAAGGVAKWDTKNMKGKAVASGVYLVLMTNSDATESKQTKIAIIR